MRRVRLLIAVAACALAVSSCSRVAPRATAQSTVASRATAQSTRTDATSDSSSSAPDSSADDTSGPGIGVDLPLRGIQPAQPFKISVWLDKATDDTSKHTVYMDPSDNFEYKPMTFTLAPGQRQTVIAKLKKNESGLAQINITSDGFADFSFNVDAGFSGKLKTITAPSMESGNTYPVSFAVVNNQEVPLHLDANAMIRVRAVNGLLQGAPDQEWVPALKIPVLAGSTSTQAFLVKPTAITGHPVVLTASMQPWQNNVVISDQRLELPVVPAWWYTLALAVLGGCVPPIYRFLTVLADNGGWQKTMWFRGTAKLLTGAVAGVIAYLFAAWDIIGVKLDMSSSRTFLILGFLFSYIGVDVLIKRVIGQQEKSSPQNEGASTEQGEAKAAKAANA